MGADYLAKAVVHGDGWWLYHESDRRSLFPKKPLKKFVLQATRSQEEASRWAGVVSSFISLFLFAGKECSVSGRP